MIGHVSASQVASELWFLLLWLLLLLLVVVVVLLLLLPRATMTLPGCMSMWTNLRCNGSALGFRQGVVLCLFSSSLFPVTMQCFIYMYVCMYVRARVLSSPLWLEHRTWPWPYPCSNTIAAYASMTEIPTLRGSYPAAAIAAVSLTLQPSIHSWRRREGGKKHTSVVLLLSKYTTKRARVSLGIESCTTWPLSRGTRARC